MTKARDLANASTALSAVSATELGYVDGVTSAIQTQIDAKLATATAASTYQAINTNVSTTELGYLDGVTSAIQTQLDAKIANTLTTTTGDIIYASAANTPARRAIGTTGQVLTVSGGVPTWAAAAGGGKVLQVVMGSTSTTVSTTSSTPTDTGLTATITPSASTSKILVLITQEYYFNKNGAGPTLGLRIMRDATAILGYGAYGIWNLSTGVVNTDGRLISPINYLDSPATTSAITYKTQGTTQNTTSLTFQETGTSVIILMEIGA
jgi:hypothetical protein